METLLNVKLKHCRFCIHVQCFLMLTFFLPYFYTYITILIPEENVFYIFLKPKYVKQSHSEAFQIWTPGGSEQV